MAEAVKVKCRLSDRGGDVVVSVAKDQSVRILIRRIQDAAEVSMTVLDWLSVCEADEAYRSPERTRSELDILGKYSMKTKAFRPRGGGKAMLLTHWCLDEHARRLSALRSTRPVFCSYWVMHVHGEGREMMHLGVWLGRREA